jgi:ABC-type sugar transport system substrate-binding protein
MKPNYTILALLVAVLAVPMAAVGQDEEAIDDIVVVGQKSINKLRRDVNQYEEDFYSAYNKLNDDPEYDVRCFYEKATGTRIKNHVCRARLVSNSYSSHAARNRSDLKRVANQGASPELAEKTVKFQDKMETLIAANPELEAVLIRYNTARADFFAGREAIANN